MTPPQPCTCLAPHNKSGEDGCENDEDGGSGESGPVNGTTEAFVTNLIANVREVVGFLESIHPTSGKDKDGGDANNDGEDGEGADGNGKKGGKEFPTGVKLVNECAVVRCLNQLDRAIRYVFMFFCF